MDEDEDCTLLCYLIAEDRPNYEFLDDDEDTHTLVLAMDAESSFHRSIHVRRLIPTERADGEARIIRQYFGANPIYTPEKFREWYRMKLHVFIRILNAVQSVDSYFQQRQDCTGLLGLSVLQKVVASMRILAYGLPLDVVDEYVQIGTSTAREALNHFCSAVIAAFGEEYLRSPTPADVARLLKEGERRGFSSMLGSIDCMHWEWQNPMERKTQRFAAVREGARKDIERAFGVLQARCGVIHGPAYGWDWEQLSYIMTACIIMHNMIVQDEKSEATNTNFENIGTQVNPSNGNVVEREAFIAAHHKLRDQARYVQLQKDLIEHNWMRYGSI